MENINGKCQPPLMLLCATMGLAVSVSLCFAQGDREVQLVTAPPEITTPFKCDSLDPKVCFDIYWRLHNESARLPNWSTAPNWSTPFAPNWSYRYDRGTGLLYNDTDIGRQVNGIPFDTVPSLPVCTPAFCWDPGPQKAFKFR
jgi:hypothetical protein